MAQQRTGGTGSGREDADPDAASRTGSGRNAAERAGTDRPLEERIRERAHRIWEEEGRPEGRAQAHWDMASELVAQQDGLRGTLEKNPAGGPDDTAQRTEPVEPSLAVENLGDLPGLTDQGEEQQFPTRDNRTDRPS